jgi:signal transduction histidine kinase/CheY-like chemotaxis protein
MDRDLVTCMPGADRQMTRSVVFVVGLVVTCAAVPAAQSPGPTTLPQQAQAARHPEEGRPFVRHYQPAEIGGTSQIWSILQDKRGVIYAGTNSGIGEFDGSTWRRIKSGAGSARALAMDAVGTIYVGTADNFGYLAPDGKGELQFVSLKSKLPQAEQNFNDVWRAFAIDSGVYFQTEQAIFKWAGGQLAIIKPTSRFNRLSEADGRLYISMPETGLNVLEADAFKPLPGTRQLALEPYPIILRYDEKRLLVGTRSNGLFLYDGATLTPFRTDSDAAFAASQIYRGARLPDGTFALTSTAGGLFIVDHQGRTVMHVTRANGLPSDVVYFVMSDREGALWVGMDSGTARLEVPSPVSFFDQLDGISSLPFDIIRDNGRLYTAYQTGVIYLNADARSSDSARFTPIPMTKSQCWSFGKVPQTDRGGPAALAVACSEGLFEIVGTTSRAIAAPVDRTFRASVLSPSKRDPTRLWVGMFDGFTSFRRQGGTWIDEGRVPDVNEQIRSLYENPDGSIWAGTANDGIMRFSHAAPASSDGARPVLKVERFGPSQGVPEGAGYVFNAAGTPMFLIGSDPPFAARFNAAAGRFEREPAFDSVEADPLGASGIGWVTAPDGKTVYVDFGRGVVVARRDANGAWTLDRTAFSRFGPGTESLYPEVDGVIWMSRAGRRFVRFDTRRATAAPVGNFPALIRRVTVNHDQPLFGGSASSATPSLGSSSNALRFEFAAPGYIDESATMYQTRLDGLETEWSDWTREARRDFTNLGFGDYRFRVRARGVSGAISEEAGYSFSILAPWYRTWLAYGSYILLLALAVYAIDRIQRYRLVGKERERARFAEAKLRAESAEALARSESEGKKNVELLSEIGREITSSLDFDTIFGKLYERVNQLADADVFGVGLYHQDRHEIEYRLAIEKGKRYAPYSRDTTDRDQLPVWCIEHREPILINDLAAEHGRYISHYEEQGRLLEDGSVSQPPQSLIYLPLIAKERVLGIITIQSFEKHAYTEHHLNVLQSLASYTSIALDNANAYRQLNEHEVEIRRLFEEAQQARAIAEEADAAKSAFLSTVSHELRTPLTSVLGFAKIIKKRLEDRIFPLVPKDDRKVVSTIQQVEDNLKVVVSEGERLTKLIDDVLDLAKIEAGKLEWHMESVTMAEIIDRATSATSSLFEHKGLHLEKQIAPDLPAVTGDQDRLIQVVINLISNAVKFTDTGTITCRATRRGGELVVSVIDTGMGIAPADQPKVFERFKQVGDTLTDKPKGTGLGLPICREIVEHHGGRIWVESQIGRGSTFSFSLPVTAEQLSLGVGVAPPVELAALIRQLREQVIVTTPRTSSHQPRILVVDDDPNIRELLSQEFVEAGYQVQLASNGREAVAAVRRERPDLIVLDVMMPEMNGFDVAAVLKNDPATMDIPIVILSIVQDLERGFRLGVDRYLTKPIDTDLLFREVGTLIEQKKSHKRVLVVDEDASTVRTLTDVLTTRGYSVMEARGDDLLERAMAVQPDIIMLNSVSSARSDAVQMLRFEKGMENVLFLVYQ